MFLTVFDKLTSAFPEARFQRHALFPSLAFWAAVAAVYAGGGGDVGHLAGAWKKWDVVRQFLAVVVGVSLLYVFAAVVASQWGRIVRVFAGHSGPLSWLWIGRKQVAWHKARREAWVAGGEQYYGRSYVRYPLNGPPLPTSLGNALLAGERYAYDRYRLDSVVVWPRLLPLVPAELTTPLTDAQQSLEGALTFSLLSGVVAVCAPWYLALGGAGWTAVVGTCVVAFAVAAAFYRAGLAHAITYSELVRVAIDLYRNKVLDAMRLPQPAGPAEERRRWQELAKFLYRNDEPSWTYEQAEAEE